MQYFLYLFLETDGQLTLSKLGEWEAENPYEYEAYLSAVNRRLEMMEQNRKKAQQKRR